MPHYVGNVRRSMIERRYTNARIVGRCDEGVTRAQARAQDPELAVALLLQPIETAADINHSLAHGIEGAAAVGGEGVVRAAGLGGAAGIGGKEGQPAEP